MNICLFLSQREYIKSCLDTDQNSGGIGGQETVSIYFDANVRSIYTLFVNDFNGEIEWPFYTKLGQLLHSSGMHCNISIH